jgi:isopropylmalate/homocitrate/citramalate synthase
MEWAGGARPKVRLREITLRQYHWQNVKLTLAEKLYWLRRLDEAGVATTALRVSDLDTTEIVVAAREAGLQIEIELYGQGWIKENWQRVIETARSSGAKCVFFTSRSADYVLEAIGSSRPEMLNSIVESTAAAKEAGLDVRVSLTYASQSDPVYLEELAVAVASAGANMIELADSKGGASPVAFRSLVSRMKRVVERTPIRVHCHNDCGQALANVFAAVEAGAEGIDVCVNGADPHRGGLANMAEVAASLELLYGVDTGINLSTLTGLSRTHEAMFGWHTPDHAPIVGQYAFGLRAAKGKRAAYAPGEIRGVEREQYYAVPKHDEPFAPEVVGNAHILLLGKYSGPNEVEKRLGELGVVMTNDDELETVAKMVKDCSQSFKRVVTDEELRYFAAVARNA